MIISKDKPVIAWWSGGVTSAVACKIAIDIWGIDNVRAVFINTNNEDDDTHRFKRDCEGWYGAEIEEVSNKKYARIQEVWYKFLSLNTAHGAICSSELKREVRIEFQRHNLFSYQVFGYDIDEPKRAKNMTLNYPEANPIYPLLLFGYSKKKCIQIIGDAGIEIPEAYKLGLNNNNCLKTGCIRGGIGYWQLMQKIKPAEFDNMADVEHDLTNLKGQPVTMLKDQSEGGGLVFLKPHPDYPHIKDISMMKGRPPKPLVDCNGYCGIDDGNRNETESEIAVTRLASDAATILKHTNMKKVKIKHYNDDNEYSQQDGIAPADLIYVGNIENVTDEVLIEAGLSYFEFLNSGKNARQGDYGVIIYWGTATI